MTDENEVFDPWAAKREADAKRNSDLLKRDYGIDYTPDPERDAKLADPDFVFMRDAAERELQGEEGAIDAATKQLTERKINEAMAEAKRLEQKQRSEEITNAITELQSHPQAFRPTDLGVEIRARIRALQREQELIDPPLPVDVAYNLEWGDK